MTAVQRAWPWIQAHRSFFPDLIRIYLGIGLAIKGLFFVLHPDTLAAHTASLPPSIVNVVPYAHLVGGALLALGLVTRVAAIIQIPIVAGALLAVNLPRVAAMQGREAMEFSALTLFLLVLVAIWGGGPLSLDRKLWTKAHPHGTDGWLASHTDLFMDLVRAYLGVGLFVKGVYILQNQTEFQKLIENVNNMPFSLLAAAHYIIPIHFVGGIMLLVGLATRLAALAQIPLLIGAIFYVYLPRFSTLELRENIEFTGLVLFLLCLFAVHGSGRYSLDARMEEKETEEVREAEPVHSGA